MSEVSFYNLNGKLYPSCENTISVNDRSFRYGDGFFETMKLVDATIQLKELHFERVKKSFEVLKFQFSKHFSLDKLEQQIIELIHKNKPHLMKSFEVIYWVEVILIQTILLLF